MANNEQRQNWSARSDARRKADEAWEATGWTRDTTDVLRAAVRAEITAHLEASVGDPETPLGHLYAMRDEDLQAEHATATEAARLEERGEADSGYVREDCPGCDGFGYITHDPTREPCSDCGGAGYHMAPAPSASGEAPGENQPVVIERGMLEFLMGEGPLMGTWFGDDPPNGERGRFWWRKYLRSRLQPTRPLSPEEVMDALGGVVEKTPEDAAAEQRIFDKYTQPTRPEGEPEPDNPNREGGEATAPLPQRRSAREAGNVAPGPGEMDEQDSPGPELPEAVGNLIESCEETLKRHRDPKDPEYNECEEAECLWCEHVREGIATVRSLVARAEKAEQERDEAREGWEFAESLHAAADRQRDEFFSAWKRSSDRIRELEAERDRAERERDEADRVVASLDSDVDSYWALVKKHLARIRDLEAKLAKAERERDRAIKRCDGWVKRYESLLPDAHPEGEGESEPDGPRARIAQ